MPRATASSNVFSAIAEPRRREIVQLLAERGPSPVLALVEAMGIPQPAVSKHLAILREAGLVGVTRRGRERIYELHADELRTVHDWTKAFERFWTHQMDRIKQRAERAAAERFRPQHDKARNEGDDR